MTAQVRLLHWCALMVKDKEHHLKKVEMVMRNLVQMVCGVVLEGVLVEKVLLKERVVLVEKVMGMEEIDGGDEPHPEDEDDHKEDEEEEEQEKDPAVRPELPATPTGSYSSSEADWRAKGYSTDIILQKKHQKEVKRVTARSAEALLTRTQEEIPEGIAIAHLEKTIEDQAMEQLEKAVQQKDQADAEMLQKKKDDARAASSQRIAEETKKKKMQDAQELRKQELLGQIEKAKAKEREAAEELRQMNKELELQQKLLEEQAALEAAAEKEKLADKPQPGGEGTLPSTVEVKEELADLADDVELELTELSSLRWCRLCNTRLYLRQGLCANMRCKGFYLLDPAAPQKICTKGNPNDGAKWSPKEWKATQKGKIESQQLLSEYKDHLEEYKDDLQEAMEEVKDAPMPPLASGPIIAEDLETQEEWKHGQEDQGYGMSKGYQDSVWSATKKKRSKGIKRVLSLHAAIEKKKARGEWYGPEHSIEMPQSQKSWLDSKVQKAIESAPWMAHKQW
eukprot:s3226_g6.t1